MRQARKSPQSRRKRCRHCRQLFSPDPRSKNNQRYCSARECQKRRQRTNEYAWRRRNPECVALQRERSRLWHKSHPAYSRNRRTDYPELAAANREQSRRRMEKLRQSSLFAKSKSILTQLAGTRADTCYLTRGRRWVLLGLTKASPLSKCLNLAHNRNRLQQTQRRLPAGCLYRFSSG